MTHCKACHKPLPDDVRADAVYCSGACRQRIYRQRKTAERKLRRAPWEVVRSSATKLQDAADSAGDLEELRELLIAVAKACHDELQKTDAMRGRFVDQQQALPD